MNLVGSFFLVILKSNTEVFNFFGKCDKCVYSKMDELKPKT